MGQKVQGYRRNEPYGRKTILLTDQGEQGSGVKINDLDKGWMFKVNPKGRVGWDMGTVDRKANEYGKSLNNGRRLRKELEEARSARGCESNGLGRKGNQKRGYVVYGEYRTGKVEDGRGRSGKSSGKPGVSENLDKPNPSTLIPSEPQPQSPIKMPTKKIPGGKPRLVYGLIPARSLDQIHTGRERVARNFETRFQTTVKRQRTNLSLRRKEKGYETYLRDQEERRSLLGPSSKRRKPDERTQAVARSGRIPTTKRRATRIARELEAGLNHMEVLRNTEALRAQHAKRSQNGRKRPRKNPEKNALKTDQKGGYYGFKVRVKGPLEGARRTMTHVIQLGTVPRGTKRARRRSNHVDSKTKIGTIGVRVTYCYGRG